MRRAAPQPHRAIALYGLQRPDHHPPPHQIATRSPAAARPPLKLEDYLGRTGVAMHEIEEKPPYEHLIVGSRRGALPRCRAGRQAAPTGAASGVVDVGAAPLLLGRLRRQLHRRVALTETARRQGGDRWRARRDGATRARAVGQGPGRVSGVTATHRGPGGPAGRRSQAGGRLRARSAPHRNRCLSSLGFAPGDSTVKPWIACCAPRGTGSADAALAEDCRQSRGAHLPQDRRLQPRAGKPVRDASRADARRAGARRRLELLRIREVPKIRRTPDDGSSLGCEPARID